MIGKYGIIFTVAGSVGTCTPASAQLVPRPSWFVPGDQAFGQEEAALFALPPDISRCVAGRITDSERASVLTTLNEIRAAHGVPPVTYDRSSEDETMAAALMMAANGQLSHQPPTNWRCYSVPGAVGAGSSNLAGGMVSPYLAFSTSREYLVGWLTDVRNMMRGTGHRRWLLSPFVTQVAFGRVGGQTADGNRTSAAVLKTFKFASEPPPSGPVPDFVAYPFGDYPQRFYQQGALLSFSPIVDKVNRWNNLKVDLARARVIVSTAGGVVPSRIESRSNLGVGYATALEFSAGSLVAGTPYHVEITGLSYNGEPLNYAYDFTLDNSAGP
ncbi:CAP domain-containing protein [Novosphingobium sp. AP12]|uniref:CAP domain-containing protein n=1 Tax=Novosphingobium sp. AP12 TaxID=1144305 RepID=UPI000271ECE1|nr:CAP domain-containing protein [Novosphingobium sp. AP12]EJL23200.1 SCP/PR1 domain protein [Novosphingobium sp. AP12]